MTKPHALTAALLLTSAATAQDAIWSPLPDYPTPIANNAVTSVKNPDATYTIYSFMGITDPPNRLTITDAAYKLTLPGGTWQPIAPAPRMQAPGTGDLLPKIAANAITIAGEVYLVGGYINRFGREFTEKRLFRYNPTTDDYTQLADVPVEVDDSVAGVYQDRYLYLISGWHGPTNNNRPNVQLYDTVADTWQQATPIPGPSSGLFGHSGTIIDNYIIYCDGVKVAAGFQISPDVYIGTIDPLQIGDLQTINWTQLPPHPGAPTYRAAPSLGPSASGLMLLTGGTDNPYNYSGTGYNGQPAFPLDFVYEFNPTTRRWNTLTQSGPHQPTMDHRGLVRIGEHHWATIGGMHEARVATPHCYKLKITPHCPADFNLDRLTNTSDAIAFLNALATEDPTSDLNNDNNYDTEDLTIFITNLTTPCP